MHMELLLVYILLSIWSPTWLMSAKKALVPSAGCDDLRGAGKLQPPHQVESPGQTPRTFSAESCGLNLRQLQQENKMVA